MARGPCLLQRLLLCSGHRSHCLLSGLLGTHSAILKTSRNTRSLRPGCFLTRQDFGGFFLGIHMWTGCRACQNTPNLHRQALVSIKLGDACVGSLQRETRPLISSQSPASFAKPSSPKPQAEILPAKRRCLVCQTNLPQNQRVASLMSLPSFRFLTFFFADSSSSPSVAEPLNVTSSGCGQKQFAGCFRTF